MKTQKVDRGLTIISRTAFLTATLLFFIDQPAFPFTISAGYDIFRTTGAGKDFSQTPIPGNFFDPGSSAFSGVMVLGGLPITNFMGIPLPSPSPTTPENQVDTIIHRMGNASLAGIGSDATIPVQMVALSLQSVAPIEIVNSFGVTEFWDVVINAPNNPIDLMTIHQNSINGGTYDALIPVDGIFTFTRQSDNAVRVLDAAAAGLPTLIFEIDNAPWLESAVIPPPSDNFLVTSIPGLTTNFIPGYSENTGRVNICGVNSNFAKHVRGDGTGWHGHVITSPTEENFFSVDYCSTLTRSVPEPSISASSVVAIFLLGFANIWRRIKQCER